MKLNIYLDMDGVLTDFCYSACEVHGKTHVEHERDPNDSCVSEYIGVEIGEFWRKIDEQGVDFWANLPKYPWADELVEVVKSYDKDFMILTSPSLGDDCEKGKKIWLKRNFGRNFRNYTFTPAKHKCRYAHTQYDLLIDDSTKNISDWADKNGLGLLFPQPWNTSYNLINRDKITHYLKLVLGYYVK